MTLSATKPKSSQPSVLGRVQARQYLGGRQVLHVAVEGRAAPLAVSTVALRDDDPWEFSEGRAVWLTWGPRAMTILDADEPMKQT